jgi:uncharacterized lipoprotein YmbA
MMLRWLAVAVFASNSSCALLTKSAPVVPRYFTPEVAAEPSRPSAPASAPQLSIRLGRIGGASYLRERMVYRDSAHELGFYEARRWTERPETYLERALASSLFEDRGFKRALASTAPTLTADLVEFEEVTGDAPRVRLRVTYALHDAQTVFLEHTLSIERVLGPGSDASRPARVADVLGEALRDAVSRIVDDVAKDLLRRAARAGDSRDVSCETQRPASCG